MQPARGASGLVGTGTSSVRLEHRKEERGCVGPMGKTGWAHHGHQGEEANPSWQGWSSFHPPTFRHRHGAGLCTESPGEGVPGAAGARTTPCPVSVFPLLLLLTSVGFQPRCKFCGLL